MQYSKEQFLEDVRAEAIALKSNATKKEIDSLDFFTLDPSNIFLCIYGQMTGHCVSDRACELMFKCCERYFFINGIMSGILHFSDLQIAISSGVVDVIDSAEELQQHRRGGIDHFSSLEAYITLAESKNKNLIEFLKGEREDLEL